MTDTARKGDRGSDPSQCSTRSGPDAGLDRHSSDVASCPTLLGSYPGLRELFAQSVDGCFFMMLDQPVRWDDSVDKERTLDYVFAHQRITEINDAMLAQYGATREEMLNRTPNDLFAHDLAHGRGLWRKFFDAGKIRLESDERRSDGAPIWIEGEYIALRDSERRIAGHFGIQRDITERKRAAEALTLFRSLVDRTRDAIEVIDPETGRFLDVNESACMAHGYTREEYLSLTVPEIDPLVAERGWESIRADLHRMGALVLESRHLRKDGSVFPVEVNCTRVTLDREYYLAVVRDITERRRAESALRESEQRLSAVIRHTPNVAIQWYDADGRVQLWNEASETMFGYSAAEAVGRTLDELIHTPEETSQFREMLARIRETGQPVGPSEYVFRRRSGDSGVCLSSIFQIPGDSFVCMDVDITDRKRAEEERRAIESQMLHAQKLESLGVLAGGIAHDFNNLLTAMLGFADLAQVTLPDDAPARPFLREIEKAAEQASGLTQQLLAYSGRGKFQIEPIRLDDLVRDLADLLQTVVSKKATIDMELGPVTIDGDATQIRQVVMNLITNASDALEGRVGTIQIRTGIRHLDPMKLRVAYRAENLPEGPYACLEVADSGAGMRGDTLERIFDPFFTTKFTGRGLGLAAVIGIVRAHRGVIAVDSQWGRGSAFQVFLPCSALATVECEPPRPSIGLPHDGGGILVVDDEPSVRELARRALEGRGYCVYTAKDGVEALELFAENRDRIVALLLDLTMPRMDGIETLSTLRGQCAEIPVLLMSGYSEQEVASRIGGLSVSGLLQKPFRARDLLASLSRLIRAQ